MSYRYRDDSGCTMFSTKRSAKHLAKVGEIKLIQGKRWQGKYGPREAVYVTGTRGTLRLSGFCWGYAGEGPRGLAKFLMSLGVQDMLALRTAHMVPRLDEPGVDWSLSKHLCGWLLRSQQRLELS